MEITDDIDRTDEPEGDSGAEFDAAELIQQVPEPYRNQILALLFQNNGPGHVPPETAKHAADAYKHTSDNELKTAELGFQYQEKELGRRHTRQGWVFLVLAVFVLMVFGGAYMMYSNGDKDLAQSLVTHTLALAFGALGGWGVAKGSN